MATNATELLPRRREVDEVADLGPVKPSPVLEPALECPNLDLATNVIEHGHGTVDADINLIVAQLAVSGASSSSSTSGSGKHILTKRLRETPKFQHWALEVRGIVYEVHYVGQGARRRRL